MIGKLNIEPLPVNIRRTNRRLTIFHKAINGHLALPTGNLQPVLRRTRHLNSKAYNTIHTSKDCYKYSFFPRTIKYWNSLPDKIATIKEPQKFKLALINAFGQFHVTTDTAQKNKSSYAEYLVLVLYCTHITCHGFKGNMQIQLNNYEISPFAQLCEKF